MGEDVVIEEVRAWYRKDFSAAFPLALQPDLEHRSATCWATPAAPKELMSPFSLRGHREFQAVGHWGYGANSWAVYLVERTHDFGLFLRVLWGCAYTRNDDVERRAVSFVLERGGALRDRFRGRAPFVQVSMNVAAWRGVIALDDVRLSTDDRRWHGDATDAEELERRLEMLLDGRTPSVGDRRPP